MEGSRGLIGRAVLAAVLPLLLFGWVAVRQPLHVDGAMNLQVAHELAFHGDYARAYEYVPYTAPPDESSAWWREHPREVQTNGPFIAVAALGLRAFGTTPFGLQFANLAFVALFALAVWALLRRAWPNLAIVAPVLVLVVLPAPYDHVLGGFGEIPALALVLGAVVALAEAAIAADDRRALRLLVVAGLFEGAAIVTKTYLAGTLPAFLVAVAVLVRLRPLPLRPVLWRLPAVLAPPALFELYRLINLGPSGYRDWWGGQIQEISYQSGADPTSDGRFAASQGALDRMRDQVHLLADRVGLPTLIVLAMLLGVLAAGAVVVVQALRQRPPSSSTRAVIVAEAFLVVQAGAYLAWWVLLVPERKAFERRTYPILVAALLAALVLGALWPWLVERWPSLSVLTKPRRLVAGAVLAGLVVVGVGAVGEGRGAVTQSTDRVHGYEEAARAVRAAPPDMTFYGTGFWSAPLVAVLADRPTHNLGETDLCTLDPEHDVLVWDEFTQIEYGSPERAGDPAIDYELMASFPAVELWRIHPPDWC